MRITAELRNAVKAAAAKYNVPVANVMAVVEVESAGAIYARVDGRNEPVIRWEGHYFDRRLQGARRELARRQGLASPKAGKVRNPGSQQARWDKLVKPATAIDADAAFQSMSWGVGQVMGSHAKALGFADAKELAAHARSGVAGQVDLMMRYCKEFDLIDELQRGDFRGFARGYNGPKAPGSYAKNMAAAAKRYSAPLDLTGTAKDPAKAERASTMLRMGSRGAKVRVAQSLLVRAGHAVTVDGDFGAATKKAVKAFQTKHRIESDGIIGPETWQKLDEYRVSPDEKPGVPNPAEAVVATPEGREGAASVGGGAVVATTAGGVKEAVQGATDQVGMVAGTGGWVDTLYTILVIVGVLLMVGGAVWALWGWWKSNRTRGDEWEPKEPVPAWDDPLEGDDLQEDFTFDEKGAPA